MQARLLETASGYQLELELPNMSASEIAKKLWSLVPNGDKYELIGLDYRLTPRRAAGHTGSCDRTAIHTRLVGTS